MYQIGYSFCAKLAHSGLWRQSCIACISQRGTGRRQRNFKQQLAFISHCEDYPPGSCLACTSGGVAWKKLWFHRFRFVSRALHCEMTHRTLVAPGNMFDPFGPWCIAWWTPRNPLRGLWCCCCWWCASWETEHDKQINNCEFQGFDIVTENQHCTTCWPAVLTILGRQVCIWALVYRCMPRLFEGIWRQSRWQWWNKSKKTLWNGFCILSRISSSCFEKFVCRLNLFSSFHRFALDSLFTS